MLWTFSWTATFHKYAEIDAIGGVHPILLHFNSI